MNDLICRLPVQVTTADCDVFGRLRAGALVNFMLQAAVRSADELGFGLSYLRANQTYWVLSRLSMQVYKPMVWRDHLEIQTWPRDIDGLYYLRDFTVRDKDGMTAAATSAWLAVDIERKRPHKLKDDTNGIFTRMSDTSSGIRKLPKLGIPSVDPEKIEAIKPVYSDFDLNGHVTTTRYIDWAMNTFPIDFHQSNRITSLAVNFLREILPDDHLELERYNLDGKYLFQGDLRHSERTAYLLETEFTPTEKS
jgi:acyl-ACP thioesterase